jgi:hypothetical protein
MSDKPNPPKQERLAEFQRRLLASPAADSFERAYELLSAVMNAVEDELTDIPYDPASWRTDGRMYPPQRDNLRDVPGHPRIKRFRSKFHSTYVGDNGAMEIRYLVTAPLGSCLRHGRQVGW